MPLLLSTAAAAGLLRLRSAVRYVVGYNVVAAAVLMPLLTWWAIDLQQGGLTFVGGFWTFVADQLGGALAPCALPIVLLLVWRKGSLNAPIGDRQHGTVAYEWTYIRGALDLTRLAMLALRLQWH